MFSIFREHWDMLKVPHELEEAWIGMVISSRHLPLLPAHWQAICAPREAVVEKQNSVNDTYVVPIYVCSHHMASWGTSACLLFPALPLLLTDWLWVCQLSQLRGYGLYRFSEKQLSFAISYWMRISVWLIGTVLNIQCSLDYRDA